MVSNCRIRVNVYTIREQGYRFDCISSERSLLEINFVETYKHCEVHGYDIEKEDSCNYLDNLCLGGIWIGVVDGPLM